MINKNLILYTINQIIYQRKNVFIKPIRSSSISQVPFVIQTPWPYTQWNYIHFSFIIEDRNDIQANYYLLDSGPLSGCENGKSIDILLPFKNNFIFGKQIKHNVFLHGFQISTVRVEYNSRSPYELQIVSTSANVTGIVVSLSVTTTTKVNYVYISFIAYQSSNLPIVGGNFVYDGTLLNASGLFYYPNTPIPRNFARMYGLTGFVLNYHEQRIKFASRWDGFKFAFEIGGDRNLLKYLSISYIFFTGAQCQDCPGFEIFFNNTCLNQCPYGTGKTVDNTCITCGEGMQWNGLQCVVACSKGRYLDPKSGECQCPPALHWNGQICVGCYSGKVWSSSKNDCECQKPLVWNGLACVKIDPCANGKIFDIYTYSCQCPETTFWNGEICENLPKCKNGLVLDSNYKCSCPQSFVWDRDSCVHSPCIGGQIWTGSNCTCPLGLNFNGSMCILCINGQIWDPRRSACFCEVSARWNGSYCVRTIDCFYGLVLDLTLKKCVCPEGTYWAGYRCIQVQKCKENQYFNLLASKCLCISGFHSNGKVCIQCTSGRVWNVTTLSCTCPPGTSQTKDGCKFKQQCSGGKQWNQNSWSCQCIAGGTIWNGNYCKANPCLWGQVWNVSLKSCQCPVNRVFLNNSCLPIQTACTNGKVWNPSTYACACPSNTYLRLTKCQVIPTCTHGKLYNPFNNLCQCPFGLLEMNSECLEPKCPNGYYYNKFQCVESRCLPPSFFSNRKCVLGDSPNCFAGYLWNGKQCTLYSPTCPLSTKWNGTTCQSSGTCQPGHYFSTSSRNCMALPQQCIPPSLWDGNKCSTFEAVCPNGTYASSAKCLPYKPCKQNSVWDPIYLQCVCPEGTINKGDECIECGNDKKWSPDTGCACPQGSFDTGSSCQFLTPGKCESVPNSIWSNNKCQCITGFTKVGFQCICQGIQVGDLCDRCSFKFNSRYNFQKNTCECNQNYTQIQEICVPKQKQLGYDNPSLCKTGSYFNKNHQACLGCSIGCLSCIDERRCKLCSPQFVYDGARERCVEKCGDGFRIVVECDDGNNVDGDGCSRDCHIQPDYTCTGGTPDSPDSCYASSTEVQLQLLGQVRISSSIILHIKFTHLPSRVLQQKVCQNKCSGILIGQIVKGDKSVSISSQLLRARDHKFAVRVQFRQTQMRNFKIRIGVSDKINGLLGGVQNLEIAVEPEHLMPIWNQLLI